MSWKSARFGTRPEDGEHFLVGHNFSFDVRQFPGIGKTAPLTQFAQILVNGNQYVLYEFNIADVLPGHTVSLSLIRP